MTQTKETIIYRLVLCLLSPVLLLWLLREAWQQKSWYWLGARLGKTEPIAADIWLHCASVGEVNAAAPLVESLHRQGKKLLITTFTPTGEQQAQRRFARLPSLQIRLLPLDWRWTMRRFMSRLDCSQLWLVETEFWPTLITEARQRGITINLINARISHKTLDAPRWWRRLLVQLLDEKISRILCRNEQDLADFRQLGMTGEHICVAGNLKWCDTIPTELPRLLDVPYIVFASTHQPEEIELARLWQQHCELSKLVIVPRHPKRGNDIATQLNNLGVMVGQRSKNAEKIDGIILADTFGELQSWMAHAELVVMGGSFAPKGGQNPLEAVRLGKLVFCGTDMRDFVVETEVLSKTGALIQVHDMNELAQAIQTEREHPHKIAAKGKAGQAWLAQNSQHILENYLQASHGLS
jgi:3-deoxy-D-manno-octulosonic-acid transferase